MIYGDISQTVGNTPLVGLPHLSPDGYTIYLKLEGHNPTGSVMDRVATYLIDQAERHGLLGPGQRVLEPTWGHAAIALAAACRGAGHPVTCVMPEGHAADDTQLVRRFGADIVRSPASEGFEGAVRLAREMAAADPSVHLPFRDGGVAGTLAHYETTGPEIIADLPDVAAFVAGLGSGGAVIGAGRRLKAWNPTVQVFAAGAGSGEDVLGLHDLDEVRLAEDVEASVVDGRVEVTSDEASQTTRELVEREGIVAGVSTGACLLVAQRISARLPEGSTIVALSPDGGGIGAHGARALWA